MAERYIRLDLNGMVLVLTKFADEKFPRIEAQTAENSRTASGNLVLFGSAVEDPHLWEFSVYRESSDRDKLLAIYREHMRLRRTLQPNFRIKLTDTTSRLVETGSVPTRARATAPFDDITNPYAGQVAYYAQYWAIFTAPPEEAFKGKQLVLQLSLEEAEEKVAP